MTSRARFKVRELRVAAQVLRIKKKQMENNSKPRFRVNRIPEAGVKDPCLGHRISLVRGMG